MKKKKQKKTLPMRRASVRALFIVALALYLASCCNDDPAPAPSGTKNANANTAASWSMINSVSEREGLNLLKVAGRLEMPKLKGGQNLFVVHTAGDDVNYAMEYDCPLKASRWTAYRWYKGLSSNETPWNRNKWKGAVWEGKTWQSDPFQEDPLIPEAYRTTLADHSKNNHDRGHMLGSADRLNSMDHNGQTFYLSNMHPQSAGFNQRGIWYNLEDRLRNVYDKDSFRDTLYVVKGGTIAEGQYTMVKGAGNEIVRPDYFFMALLCKNSQASQGGYKAIAFWMKHEDNKDSDFKKYAISIDRLEELTGIDFFCNLPDNLEEQVEKNLVLSAWGL